LNRLIALLCVLVVVLGLTGCKKEETPAGGAVATNEPVKPDSNSDTSAENSVEAEVKAMMEGQIDAMNKENVDAYLVTVDPDSPAYDPTKEQIKKLFDMYDLQATLDSFQLVSSKDDEAEARTTITTKKIKGPQFNDNKVIALHTVKKKDGKWVVVASKIEEIKKP